MIISKRNRAKQVRENASLGTAMLDKYTRMTPQLAYYSGKRGKADLHMHSTHSDGSGTIEQILDHVQHATDLDVIALTDHDVIEGALRARDLWSKGSYRFDFVVGEEVTTKEGHLLGLFIEKRVPSGLSMERSIDLIHAQGGLAVIAHPLHRFFRHSCQREVMDRIHASKDVWFDGIETWNASFCGIYANYIAMGANRTIYGLPELGNSDAHTLNSIGYGITWFEGSRAQDVRATIEKGLTAPGGRLWDVPVYLDYARHLISKEGRLARRSHEAVA
ncbi:MAG TPA: PHP-associated domain-containing protein [Ktedonosporobacter sp.]|nr:PHP-associated domain-containing protein [Ktedonosporobacter sp.]